MDCESKLLYGHIVSGYPGSRTAYLVPARKIFDEIAEHFGEATISNPDNWTSSPTNTSQDLALEPSNSDQKRMSTEYDNAHVMSSGWETGVAELMDISVLNQPWRSLNFMRPLYNSPEPSVYRQFTGA